MKRYTVGIDLGTSNTVVAYRALDSSGSADAGNGDIRVFEIEQLVAPGQVQTQALLPSARYHPAEGELNAADRRLPWPEDVSPANGAVIGRWARALGAKVPGRLVASAKSWLSHASVDQLAPILPWGATDDVAKVSPVDASASYLAHVRAAWNARFPDAPLEAQDVVLTVPASFDEGARALTLEATKRARLPALRLVEEPQAAFYDWLYRHRDTLAQSLAHSRLVLICDVGGGTTDLTLIKVALDASGEPQMTRIGVGNHLMLGGDNMDLALARLVESRLAQGAPGEPAAARLTAADLSQLVERCRVAKEQLLAEDAPESVAITLLGAGSRLIGGARTAHLTRDEVERVVLDGFFPRTEPDARPHRSRAALIEFGLPYASDPAVTRHIAAFLARHAAPSRDALGDRAPDANGNDDVLPVPDTLLLNGGVFRAGKLAQRLADTLGAWRGAPLTVLNNANPDIAVARGAVAYALARAGHAPRVGGGSPRSYFLLLDDAQAICLLPRGTEEGHAISLDDRVFELRLGEPVRFTLLATNADTRYRAGELTSLERGDFVRLPPVATVLQAHGARPVQAQQQRSDTRVRLVTSMSEVGTLDVMCIAADDPSQHWQLPFELRRESDRAIDSAAPGETARPRGIDDAFEAIEHAFGARVTGVARTDIKRLRAQLEQALGPREQWSAPVLRELFDALWARAKRRRRSADHERLWLNLAGYCVRPGFGHPLDEWRVAQLWTLFDDGIQYIHDSQVWSEWWTLWRRAAGGLGESEQQDLLDAMEMLQDANIRKQKLPFDPLKVGHADMMRVQASLERIAVKDKIALVEQLMTRLSARPQKISEVPQIWWAIGRIGARLPFYGSAHTVVPPEAALPWLDAALALDWKRVETAAFAAAQIARLTGDRSRDLPDDARDAVARRLATQSGAASWVRMVREVVSLDEADSSRVFGETLPTALRLLG
ncbi:Hsp70 family protein [Paraburkholderia jirisanensis]